MKTGEKLPAEASQIAIKMMRMTFSDMQPPAGHRWVVDLCFLILIICLVGGFFFSLWSFLWCEVSLKPFYDWNDVFSHFHYYDMMKYPLTIPQCRL